MQLAAIVMKTEAIIKNIFIELFGVEESEVTPETTNNDLQLDSLDKVELIMKIEQQFNIEITDNEADSCKQVSHYIELVNGKLRSMV